jgi:hypothetical protein
MPVPPLVEHCHGIEQGNRQPEDTMYAATPESAKAEQAYRRNRASTDLHQGGHPRRWRLGRAPRHQAG